MALMGGTYRGRTAPTPSGPLHLGNLRTALLAWLFARRAGGAFVVRMEDLDRPRVRMGAAEAILKDMRWLGLDWDEGPDVGGPYAPYTQSDRLPLYRDHLALLQEAGLVYPCYCSRADIARAASAPHGAAEEGPRYPGTCADPEGRARQRERAGGRPPAWRFRAPAGVIHVDDGLLGSVEQDVAESAGDVVVWRGDDVPAYHLAVVVDDGLMAISDVVRGADLLPSTPRQVALYRAFGYPPPRFLHVPLAVDESGSRLAKRSGAVGVGPLREEGIAATRVVGALAASAGLVEEGASMTARDLLAVFDPARLGRDPSSIGVRGTSRSTG